MLNEIQAVAGAVAQPLQEPLQEIPTPPEPNSQAVAAVAAITAHRGPLEAYPTGRN